MRSAIFLFQRAITQGAGSRDIGLSMSGIVRLSLNVGHGRTVACSVRQGKQNRWDVHKPGPATILPGKEAALTYQALLEFLCTLSDRDLLFARHRPDGERI
jgi:hypothetical protein